MPLEVQWRVGYASGPADGLIQWLFIKPASCKEFPAIDVRSKGETANPTPQARAVSSTPTTNILARLGNIFAASEAASQAPEMRQPEARSER
ncbi:hypothetical protein GCM10025785_03960 [Corynebacterium canis]